VEGLCHFVLRAPASEATIIFERGDIMKRALILFGAGASIDYKAPSTTGLTAAIEKAVLADPYLQHTGGDTAYEAIKAELAAYLSDPNSINFEQIYHCSHELLATFLTATPGAADEFKPILIPFLSNRLGFSREALSSLCDKMVEVIFREVSDCCSNPALDLESLTGFLENIRASYITRIYTTNYDDFPLQAVPDLYDGFERSAAGPRRFDIDRFWRKEHADGIFHVHGSVHMGFLKPPIGEIGELGWFDDRAEALRHSSFTGSSPQRMDGTSVLLTAVITGLEKLSRVQQRPFVHFYSMMARDAMRADVIFVIGSGLADLHLNACLAEARSRKSKPPLLYVDWWPNNFEEDTSFEPDRKSIQLFHRLQVHIAETHGGTRKGGWIVSEERTSAIWDRGFSNFLSEPEQLAEILSELMGTNAPTTIDRLLRRCYRSFSKPRA
jgi:hypothetical protein